jgi:glycosyltransferase involved in cell wall biosynthesis
MSSSELPLVSIITPTYNHHKFIGECIKSVLDQTYTNWKQIIIDDGSIDSTYEAAILAAQGDPRIKVIRQENVGIFKLGETYNKALALSTGKYIAVLEGDDYWEIDKLERQVEAMERNPNAVMSWGKGSSIADRSREILTSGPELDNENAKYFNNKPVGSMLNILFYDNCIPALTIFIRRKSLEEIGGFIQNFNLPLVDMPTLMELSLTGEFCFIPENLGYWRIFSEQATKTHTARISEGIYDLRHHFLAKIRTLPTNVISVNISEFEKINKAMLIMDYSRNGRYELIRKNYLQAREHYKNSLFKFGFLALDWKIRSLIGLVFSYLKMDVEGLADLVGKGRIDR